MSLPHFTSPEQMRQAADKWRCEGQRIGFVPTMGALHEGHLSLIRRSVADGNDVTLLSIFVNPTQFGPSEDLASYPRTLEDDSRLAVQAGATHLFLPTEQAMYPEGHRTEVRVTELSAPLCGQSRPVHFPGVALVVLKLLALIRPHKAYFGQKDYQQCLVVQRLTADMLLPTEIVACPTVREADGLAMSSRNKYLTPEQRKRAPLFQQTLQAIASRCREFPLEATAALAEGKQTLEQSGLAVDYLDLRDSQTLSPLDALTGPAVLAGAVFLGKARLIDNLLIEPSHKTES